MHTDETEDLLVAVKAADWIERLPTAGRNEQEAFLAGSPNRHDMSTRFSSP